MSKLAIVRAQSAIANERFAGGLEGDDETILLHLLADLIEWCDHKKVDLQVALEDAQEMVRETEG